MATGDGIDGADIVRLTQNGQNLYTQGKIPEAVREFQQAHYYAVRLNHKKTLETCAFNLASAYAANKNGKKALEQLRTLSRNFMDSVDEGELTFLYGLAEQHNTNNTNTVRIVKHYRNALQQLNRLQSNMHASLKKYILEQLCELEKNDSVELIDYMHQLADVYAYLKMPFRRLQLLCERANLLCKMRHEDDAIKVAEDCFIVIQELQGKRVTHLAGKDSEMQETLEQCLDIANTTDASNQIVPILNEIGLLFTQLQDTDQALECFMKAHDILSEADQNSRRNDSVLLQNIGAVYNFKIVHTLDFVPQALSYHTKALKQYGKQKNGKSQGHCYLNKAYAESRRQDMTGAQEAYILALHKAEEKNDFRTQWQALEGLGAVACNNRDLRKAQEYLRQALKLVHQDEQDITQSTASERILEKLLQLNRRKGFGRDITRAGSRIDTLISIDGPDQSMRSIGQRSRSAPQDDVDKLTKIVRRELKIRKSGSLRRFPKVAIGLAPDTLDMTLRESGEESLTSLTSEQTLSSDSSSSTSSNSSDSEAIPRSRQKIAVSKGDGRQTITPRMSMRRPQPKSSSSSLSRRQSQKGLKTSLLQSESEDDDKQALINAYRRLHSKGEGDEESDSQVSEDDTARTPRESQGHINPRTKQGSNDDEESIKEKSDDHVDTDVRSKKGQSSDATKNDAPTSAVKREGSGLSGTKSLRFQSPVDTSDEEEEDNRQPTNTRSQVEVDVHQPQRSVPSDQRPKGKIEPPVVESESEYDSDSDTDTLSEEETEVARQAPALPTQSPPVSPSNTYEKPVSKKTLMRDNSLYEDASRQSTGHYAEIDFSNTDSARQQGEKASDVAMPNRKMRRGPNYFNSSDENETKEPHSEKSKTASEKSGAGETSQSAGESTVYETIRPPDSTRSDNVTSDSARSAAQRDESGYTRDHSTDESDEESGRGLSRAEKDQQMLKYHLQQKQEREEEEKEEEEEEEEEEKEKKDKKGKSRTCVIS